MAIDLLDYSEMGSFASQYYVPNRPVVIRGIRKQRNLGIFQWSVDHLASLVGAKKVPVMATRTGFLSYERNFVDMPFSEFAERMFVPDPETGVRYYYKNPTSMLPSLNDDSMEIEPLRPYISRAVARNLWISSSGLTVGLHFDPADNLNFQLRGNKAFWLYPPGVAPYYPLPMFSQTAHISGVFRNGPDPDFSKFPRFRAENGVRVELQEGDVLYIPAYWWHQVESLGRENLNLNFWWLPRLSKQLANWNQAMRGHAQVLLRYIKYGNIQQAPADKT